MFVGLKKFYSFKTKRTSTKALCECDSCKNTFLTFKSKALKNKKTTLTFCSAICIKKSRQKGNALDKAIRSTTIKNNGYEHNFQIPEINILAHTEQANIKRINTNIERYNVVNVFQSEIIKDKIKTTLLVRYGVTHPMQSEAIKQKIVETNILKYGFISPLQSPIIKAKIVQTCLERYNVTNPFCYAPF